MSLRVSVATSLLASAALAQVLPSPIPSPVGTTTGAQVISVSSSQGAGAMQAAERSIPKYVDHPIEVSVGAGNFNCSTWDGFTFSSDYASGSYGSLWVHGATAAASITGAQTGTVASATDITNVPGVLPTVTVTGAGWTTNALRGLLFKVTAGPGAGETLVIASNTATVLTLAGGYSGSTAFWPMMQIITPICSPFAEYTLPTNASTFAILANATHITTDCAIPNGPNPTGLMGSYSGQANDSAGIIISGMRSEAQTGAFTLGGNEANGYCSPQAPVAFTNFDFNDAASNSSFYAANSDAVHLRWNSNTAGFEAFATWQNVGRMSLFSNTIFGGNCLFGIDAYPGHTALITGNVSGKIDASSGCIMYDGLSYVPGPAELISGLNSMYTHGVRTGYNLIGVRLFSEFDDTINGFTQVGVAIGNANTSGTIAASIGTSALIASSDFEGAAGATTGILLEPNNYLYMTSNQGDGGTFGLKIIGPASTYFASGAINNLVGGTTAQICQDPSCTSNIKYTDVGSDKNIQFGTIGGAHKFITAATTVPASTGCADTAETTPGSLVDVPCYVSPHSTPTSAGGATWSCYASAAGTIQLHLCCVTATCTANSVTWTLEQQP